MREPHLYRYPTDLRDAEWSALGPLLPSDAGGRRDAAVAVKRTSDFRALAGVQSLPRLAVVAGWHV